MAISQIRSHSTVPSAVSVLATMMARLVAMIGPFGVSIITARMLGPENRGRYFFILSLAQIAAQIANLGLTSSNTYLAASRPHVATRLAINSVMVSFVVAPAAAALVVAAVTVPEYLSPTLGAQSNISPSMLLAMLLAPLILLFLYLSNLAVATGKIGLFNFVTIFSGVAAITSALIVASIDGNVAEYLFAASISLLFSCLLTAAFILRGHIVLKFDVPLFREGVSYALRAYFATLFGFLLMRVGIIALQQRSDFVQVGQFSIAVQMSDAMILLPATVGLLLFPNLVRAHPDKRWPEMLRALRRLGAAMAVLLVAAAAVVPFAIPLVYGSAFKAAGPLTLAMLPMVQIVTLTTVVSQYLSAEGFPLRQVAAWVVGFLVQAVLSFALAGPYGGYGIACASFISNAVVLVLLAWEAIRLSRLPRNGSILPADTAQRLT